MVVTHVILWTFTLISLSTKASGQYQNGGSTRNLIASALQDILSTSNTEGALQMLKMSAGPTHKSIVSETTMPVRNVLPKTTENYPLQTYVTNEIPRPILSNDMPCVMPNKEMRIVSPAEITMPRVAANNEVMAYIDPNELAMPRMIANKDIRTVMGPREICSPCAMANKEVFIGPNEVIMPRVMRQMMPDVYERQIFARPVMEANRNIYETRVVNYTPVLGDDVSCPYSPPSLMNPFLPIASPVSAFSATTSNMLPPPTQARSQYLRKIPIPPPTL